ncbi:MAG: hypothetical protein QW767_02610 [Thermoprotei archaeon]
MFKGSTVGQQVKMLETEYVANLSSIPRERYDKGVEERFLSFVKMCDRVLADRRIAPSQADKIMSYKLLVETELEWIRKRQLSGQSGGRKTV